MLIKLLRNSALLILLGWLQLSQLQVIAHEATHWLHDGTQLCDDLQLAHHSPALVAALQIVPSIAPPSLEFFPPALVPWFASNHRPQLARALPYA